jgi:nitrate reductase delta subunit
MNRAAGARIFGCAAVLLSYPDESFSEDLAAVASAAAELPSGRPATAIGDTAAWLSRMTSMEAAAIYVDTFDLRRGTSLYLTYYRHGDTRQRGLALAALIEAYKVAGFAPTPGELPDFLPALLELAAAHRSGAALLAEHRPAIDALRAVLDKSGSPYAAVVAAIAEALPSPSRADRAALERYLAQGPPSETVGLEPFAPPDVLEQGMTRR